MSTQNKIPFAVLAAAGGLSASLSLAGWAEGWHAWPLPAAASACVGVVLSTRARSGSMSALPTAQFDSGAPHLAGPHWENPVNGVRIPSRAVDYDFLFSAVVRWRPTGAESTWRERANANPGSQAVNAIVERARGAAAMEQPESHREAQNRLAAALGVALPDSTGRVEAWATNVSLNLPPEDLERVTKLADLRKEADLWARRRAFEREQRSYLGQEVFKDTGSAVMWMLAQTTEHSEQDVERAVRLIGPLALLAAAANDSPVSELYRHLVGPAEHAADGNAYDEGSFTRNAGISEAEGHIETLFDHVSNVIRDFAADSDSERSATFARRMAGVFELCEQPQTAQRLRAAFGLREPDHADSDTDSNTLPDTRHPFPATNSGPVLDDPHASGRPTAGQFAPNNGSGDSGTRKERDLPAPDADADGDSVDGWEPWEHED
jgi:hypothetical protein